MEWALGDVSRRSISLSSQVLSGKVSAITARGLGHVMVAMSPQIRRAYVGFDLGDDRRVMLTSIALRDAGPSKLIDFGIEGSNDELHWTRLRSHDSGRGVWESDSDDVLVKIVTKKAFQMFRVVLTARSY